MLNYCLPEPLYPVIVLIGFCFIVITYDIRYLKLTVYHGQCELIANLHVLLCAVLYIALMIVFCNSFTIIVVRIYCTQCVINLRTRASLTQSQLLTLRSTD